MTDYRVVVRHVRYWRGAVHKWSTVYPITGSIAGSNYAGVIAQFHALEQVTCYPAPSGHGGGVWEIALYNQASGGTPISISSYFDPDTPSAWVAYDGTSWQDLTKDLVSAAEVALQAEWLAGFSSSGKPVRFRKWFHSVPEANAVPGAADMTGSQITQLQTNIDTYIGAISTYGVLLGSGSRLAAAHVTVLSDYGNHQMPRGRRKPPTKVSSAVAKLPPGILIVPGSDGSLDS